MPESTVRSFMGEQMKDQQLYFDPKKWLNIESPWQGTSIGNMARIVRGFYLGDKIAGNLLNNVTAYRKLAEVRKIGPFPKGGELAQAMIRDGLVMKSSIYRHEHWGELQEAASDIHPILGYAIGFIAVGLPINPYLNEEKSYFSDVKVAHQPLVLFTRSAFVLVVQYEVFLDLQSEYFVIAKLCGLTF